MWHYWWKILSAIIVLATIIFGLGTPLSPGIPAVEPDRINNGVTSLTIKGYNTRFTDNPDAIKVWITNGDATFCPYEKTVVDDTHIRVTFSVTEKIADAFFDLYVNTPREGTMYLPSALLQNGLEVSLNPDEGDDCISTVSAAADAFDFPNQPILNETIRNVFYHVPSWFAMIFILVVSLVHSVIFLNKGNPLSDISAANAAKVGLLFALIGLGTGSVWARFTWGAWWVNDPRLNGAAIAVLIYLAYFVLRSSVNDSEKAGRLAAVYNIFAFVMMVLFVLILPRLTDSLHPGAGGNPAFNQYDLDDNMRVVLYPAIIAWFGMAYWIYDLKNRMEKMKFKQIMKDDY
ncbi:MAG: cytochrome c biogenesis protein [Cryomorphaceae bacterium]|nr:cytochrome c biogenesis protein [Flavobacteriales bacterium]